MVKKFKQQPDGKTSIRLPVALRELIEREAYDRETTVTAVVTEKLKGAYADKLKTAKAKQVSFLD